MKSEHVLSKYALELLLSKRHMRRATFCFETPGPNYLHKPKRLDTEESIPSMFALNCIW